MRITFLALFVLFISSIRVEAQLVITDDLDATQLAVGIFQGVGVSITNATLQGSNTSISTSAGGYSSTGISIVPESGVIIASGPILGIADSAQAFLSGDVVSSMPDTDLETITGGQVNNVTALEFDFVPDADLLLFDYVFASEEYPEFVCSFNDAFGFFLSGPGISGPFANGAINIALLPDMVTPVSINNVNNGLNNDPIDANCPAQNPELYYDNTGGGDVVFDGMTTILQAEAYLIPGETYHVKLAIGDAIDSVWDSGLFLKEQSFRSIQSITVGLNNSTTSSIKVLFDRQGRLQLLGTGTLAAIQLHDAQGRLIRSEGKLGLPASMDTSELPHGVYFINAMRDGAPYRTKLVKN